MLPRVFLSLITSHLAGLHRSTAVPREEELFYRTADGLVVKHFWEREEEREEGDMSEECCATSESEKAQIFFAFTYSPL